MWLFLWLIDKTTSEEISGGERWGIVLYGKPVSSKKIAGHLFINDRTIRRYLAQLEEGGYIQMQKHLHGHVIFVRKSVKWLLRAEKRPARYNTKPLNALDRLANFVQEGGD